MIAIIASDVKAIPHELQRRLQGGGSTDDASCRRTLTRRD
jgi:hypothetical protein